MLMAKRKPEDSQAPASSHENFEPPIRAGLTIPDSVIDQRRLGEAEAKRLAEILEPRIADHLLVYREVVDTLASVHQEIGETMDFGFQCRTRWAAVWELAGRCLGLSNCMLVQLQGGFASEVVPTMRSMHEAGQLLTVVTGPGEEGLLRRWLNDERYIKAQQARAAEGRIAKPFIRELATQGIEVKGDQFLLGRDVYNMLSKPAHNMRGGFLESVSKSQRLFAYGPHPDLVQRAVHVEFGGQQIQEVALRVGGSLATRFLGRTFYADTVEPLLASVKAVRTTMPVDPVSVRRL
jgi:hypothetical protein